MSVYAPSIPLLSFQALINYIEKTTTKNQFIIPGRCYYYGKIK
jgi:hypothetical protein